MKTPSSSREILAIPLGKIKVAPAHPLIDEGHAQMIAASMAALGPVTPVEVRAADRDGQYLLVSGYHRHRAAQLAGIACLPAIVIDEPASRRQAPGIARLPILDTVDVLEACLSGPGYEPPRADRRMGDFPIRSE